MYVRRFILKTSLKLNFLYHTFQLRRIINALLMHVLFVDENP